MNKTRGTTGIDVMNGTNKVDYFVGLDGDDFIFGRGGTDLLKGGEGNDQLDGGAGRDKLFGDGDSDLLLGDSGADVLSGGDGNDTIVGGSGNDVIKGGDGNDRMFSNVGDDRMNGGEGDDYYEIGRGTVTALDPKGNDEYVVIAGSSLTIDDGDGVDKLRFKDIDGGFTVDMNKLMFQRSGDDLVIIVEGHEDGATTIASFYAEEFHRVEQIYDEAGDVHSLEDEDILHLADGDAPIRGADIWDI